MPNNEQKSYRFYELDALRGIAALIVLISHYTWAYDFHFNLMSEHSFHFRFGDFGVQLFFMISGFVIFMSLVAINNIQQFVIARFSRLYPTYWVCIAITVLFVTFLPTPTLEIKNFSQILVNLTMIQGHLRVRHIDEVYWSLGIEFFFYFIMGMIYYLKKLHRINVISFIWLLICIITTYWEFPFSKIILNLLIVRYAPLFIAGIFFFRLRTVPQDKVSHILILMTLIVNILYVLKGHEDISIRIFYLTIIYGIFYLLTYFKISLFYNRILLFLGDISYPLYLLHNVIGYTIIFRIRAVSNNQFVYVLITTLTTVLLAYLVSKFIEKPSNRFLKSTVSKLLQKK